LQQYLRPFQFVGGGVPESQAANNPLITGDGMPAPDRAAYRDPAAPPGENERRERAESPPFDSAGAVRHLTGAWRRLLSASRRGARATGPLASGWRPR
jgi:hypothetical protein